MKAGARLCGQEENSSRETSLIEYSIRLNYFATQQWFQEHPFYHVQSDGQSLIPIAKWILLTFSDGESLLYSQRDSFESSQDSILSVYQLNDPELEADYPKLICIKCSRIRGALDRDFRIYRELLRDGDFCQDTILFGYPFLTNLSTEQREPLILMDKMDETLRQLVRDVLNTLPFHIKILYILNITLQITYACQCLYEQGYYYLDNRLEHCLYRTDDTCIYFFLADLGSVSRSDEQVRLNYVYPSIRPTDNFHSSQQLLYGCVLFMLQMITNSELSFLHEEKSTILQRLSCWHKICQPDNFKVIGLRIDSTSKDPRTDFLRAYRALFVIQPEYKTDIVELINMANQPSDDLLPFLNKLYSTYHMFVSFLREKVDLPVLPEYLEFLKL